MSGINETPRQKMIGMMYLVLTALLALNVSTTVLDKFAFINQSLEKANSEVAVRNRQTLAGMKQSVKDKGDRSDDKAILAISEQLRTETQLLLDSLEEIKETFIQITGGYANEAEYGKDRMHIIGKTNYDKVGHYMIPKEEGGDGNGKLLKDMLNSYSSYIRDALLKSGIDVKNLSKFNPLALDASEDEYWKKDPNQKGKKWSQIQFNDSPTHAALATISEFQANVLSYETEALDYLKKRVGLKDISFDEIKPVVMPNSRYVAVGTKYTAEMFIAASASGLNDKLIMKQDGNAIPVVDGIGTVEFTATTGNFDEDGIAKKTFEASIVVPQGGGTDTTFTSTIEYFVTKPVMQIQSQSVNALYYNCGNKLDIQVPVLGALYNPSFSVTGGRAIKGSKRGLVTIVPRARKVVLTVSSSGTRIDSRAFSVRQIPAPQIVVYGSNRKPVNMKQGISAKTSKIYIKAEADESFKQFLPDDAKFRIAQAEVTLVSGGLGRKSIKATEEISVSRLGARKGDQIVIEIKRVQRQNFNKEVENFQRFQKYINISIN